MCLFIAISPCPLSLAHYLLKKEEPPYCIPCQKQGVRPSDMFFVKDKNCKLLEEDEEEKPKKEKKESKYSCDQEMLEMMKYYLSKRDESSKKDDKTSERISSSAKPLTKPRAWLTLPLAPREKKSLWAST